LWLFEVFTTPDQILIRVFEVFTTQDQIRVRAL